MSYTDISDPPINWVLGVSEINPGIYYLGTDVDSLVIWHWCNQKKMWLAQGVVHHTLVNAFPLHLEPSLMFDCCGLHGYIRAGKWSSA
jgi:hypothetical protein